MGSWSAHVQVKWNKKAPVSKDWNWLKNWKEVRYAWSTMGDWDMTFWVDVKTPEELETFVNSKLRETDWVEATRSTWVKRVWEST